MAQKERLPLSITQHRLWIQVQANPTAARQIRVRARLRGHLDEAALRAALDGIVARHEILRSTFESVDHTPVQIVGPNSTGFELIKQEAMGLRSEARCQPGESHFFDLSRGPLIRGRLSRVSEREHELLITSHKIVIDSSSVGILMRELVAFYDAIVVGRDEPLHPLDLQYADYASWQLEQVPSEALKGQLEFCAKQSSELPERLQLAVDRPRVRARSSERDRVQLTLSPTLTMRIRDLSQRWCIPTIGILLSGWAVQLGRSSGQEEVVIGTRVFDRPRQELEEVIGPFESVHALLIQLQENSTFGDLLRDVREALRRASITNNESHENVTEATGAVCNHASQPQALIEFNDTSSLVTSTTEFQLPQLKISDVCVLDEEPEVELLLSLVDNGTTIGGSLTYAEDLFERTTIEHMVQCFEILLDVMTRDIGVAICRAAMITPAQRSTVLYRFNETETESPREWLVHELFEAQVARTPASIALIYEQKALTFAEVNRRANQLARHLRTVGVKPDQLIALCVERSVEMVVAMLGVLKAGGAYVPLDPTYPISRLSFMLKDAAPRILLIQTHLMSVLPLTAEVVIAVDGNWQEISEHDDSNLDVNTVGVTPRNLAYVIYTSGSTGIPKGAMNEHLGMANRIEGQQSIEAFSEGDVCCQRVSSSFVDSVFETFGPLCAGVPLVIIPPAVASDVEKMAALIAREHVTRLVTVPSLARSLLENQRVMQDLCNLRSWTLSGEAVRADLLAKLTRRLPRCEFIVQYGASEVSSDAAIYKTTNFLEESVPLGRPMQNVQVYVLDPYGEPVDTGVTGEIHVGGVGVGRGYLNRPDLTASRFVPDRFGDSNHRGRLYRTGDLGRWRADGMLEYLGRNDQLVKIRGFRVELGEIEAQIMRHGHVREAVVLAREDVPTQTRLVAYITLPDSRTMSGAPDTMVLATGGRADAQRSAEQDATPLVVESLRSRLREALPAYMVPAAFVIMTDMPRTPNGKLDRRSLPPPDQQAFSMRQYEAPRGENERKLASVWQEILQLSRVGRHDNFFELGGHSLLIVQMKERLRAIGLSTEVGNVYECRTLSDLAATLSVEAIGGETEQHGIPLGCAEIEPQMLPLVELTAEEIRHIVGSVPGGAANVKDVYPLTPMQEGMLFHHLLDEAGEDAYILLTLLLVSDKERLEALISALQAVIDRYDILRTAILWEKLPQPVQVVWKQVNLPVEEVQFDTSANLEDQIAAWIKPNRHRMDVRLAPLMRLQIAANPYNKHWYALLKMHHVVDDDISLRILVNEIVLHLNDRATELPAPVQYRDHVAHVIERARTHDAATFFRRKLGDIEESTAPFGVLDVNTQAGTKNVYREFDRMLAQRLRLQARILGVTAATLFHVSWGLVLARITGRDDVVFGSVLLGRLQDSTAGHQSVGMFVNTLPLRLKLKTVSALGLVGQAQRELAELLNHEQASLSMAQRCSGISGSVPLFTSTLNYRHSESSPEAEWSRAAGIRMLHHQYSSTYPIALAVDDLGVGFTITAKTDGRVNPDEIVGYMQAAVQSLVGALEHAPLTPAMALSVLPEAEWKNVIETFNSTRVEYPHGRLVHELIEDQVRRAPDAIAVVHEEQALTYAEMNLRANQLARYLLSRRLRPKLLVAVYMERSLDLLISLLATLKAGAAYVPLDPNNSAERLECVLTDARPQLLLTHEILEGTLPPTAAEVIVLDREWGEITKHRQDDLDRHSLQSSPTDLAYVIYTSGSTGQPKGVMIEHRSVVNYSAHALQQFDIAAGNGSVICTSLSFDLALTGLYPVLLAGRTVRLCSQVRRISDLTTELLGCSNLAPLKLTPSHLSVLENLLTSGQLAGRVKVLVIGGEPLQAKSVRLWQTYAPSTRIFNHYGPTEATIGCVVNEIAENLSEGGVPIGRPISNTHVYVLDSYLQPVPIGVTGEIFIGGAGVARGYLNQPGLTAERFLADPFSADPTARLYKTGDLGRWRADGMIECLGRNDHQVKIRGHRIELGEIEARLLQHERVKEAIVLARADESGEKQLVAYFVEKSPVLSPKEGHALNQRDDDGKSSENEIKEQVISQLRDYLRTHLPAYMIPSAWMVLDKFPLTPNGKVNRRVLPTAQQRLDNRGEYIPPRTELERMLADIWARVLRMERVGIEDDFFEIGGHSLLAMQVVVRIRSALSIEMPMKFMFEYPTIAALSSQVEHLRLARLLEALAGGGEDMQELLERVESLSDSRVEELAQELRREVTP